MSLACGLYLGAHATAGEPRTWTSYTGTKVEATFVGMEGGRVVLAREDGRRIRLLPAQLAPDDRARVFRLQREASQPWRSGDGRIDKSLVFDKFESDAPWPDRLSPKVVRALENIGIAWRHAKSRHFTIHFSKETYARRVARMGDFFHDFIARDLKGLEPVRDEPSHVYVFDEAEEWKIFLATSENPLQWAAAYVHGLDLFVQDFGETEDSAAVLGHEMSHLVLNRYFRHRPPLWLNEGMAEWYGAKVWSEFKGTYFDDKDILEEGRRGRLPVGDVLYARGYPADPRALGAYYGMSKLLTGFLRLEGGRDTFAAFLRDVVTRGTPWPEAMKRHYPFAPDSPEFTAAFEAALD